jgi:hypothetical protein
MNNLYEDLSENNSLDEEDDERDKKLADLIDIFEPSVISFF